MNIRKQIRLKDYDYSQNGAYFVTICTKNKDHLFGSIGDCVRRDDPCGCPDMSYTKLGYIAQSCIAKIENIYDIKFDKYVIMPNHIHAIIVIENGQPQGSSLQQIIGAYKSIVSVSYLHYCKQNNIIMGQIWQRSFHDHVIRNQASYDEIWNYIDTNPLRWHEDRYYTK